MSTFRKNLLFGLSLIVMISCQETIEEPNESFIKVLGQELSSFGSKIKQLSTGEIVVLGQTEAISYDSTSSSYLSIASPSIYIIDKEGNVVREKIFSFNELIASGGVGRTLYLDFENDNTNTGYITDLIALGGNQYLALGHWEQTEVAQRILDPLTATIDFPFQLLLDNDFNILDFLYINGERGWDFNLKSDQKLILGPENSLYLFYKSVLDVDYSWSGPIFHSVSRIDNPFEWVYSSTSIAPAFTNKGLDLNFSSNGNPLILVQSDSYLIIEIFDASSGSKTESYSIDSEEAFDEMEGQIVEIIDGFLIVAQVSGRDIKFYKIDETLSSSVHLTLPETDSEIIIDATKTSDDHLLLLTGFVGIDKGVLRKINSTGTVLWEFQLADTPSDVEEINGAPYCLYNPVFNGQLRKATLIKLSPEGTL